MFKLSLVDIQLIELIYTLHSGYLQCLAGAVSRINRALVFLLKDWLRKQIGFSRKDMCDQGWSGSLASRECAQEFSLVAFAATQYCLGLCPGSKIPNGVARLRARARFFLRGICG